MKHLFPKLLIALMLSALLLPLLASCGGVELELYFVVDGEVYDTITTNGAEKIKLPPNPEKEGYVFRGWYWDYGIWEEPFTATSLVEAPLSSSMSVYARFIPLEGEETTQPPTTEPPATEPPATEPPTTEPPTTEPPTTEPPTTEPPTTEPPTTEPPSTEPPTTEPPTTEPPTTEPPTTEPDPDDPVPPELKATDIATIIASENGDFKANGVVIGVNAQSFLLGDSTGMMLVYLKADPGVSVGDRVTVEGATTVYGGAKQFGIGTGVTVEQSGITVKHPEPEILTIDQLNAYAKASEVTVKYVKLTGDLVPSGAYYNLNLGAAVIGSLTYPDYDLRNVLDSMAGQTVEVYGYVTGVTGGNQYLSIMTTEVKLVTPEQPPEPEIIGEISIADAIAMGNAMEHNTTTYGLYVVTGTIVSIGNTTYGNMYVTDDLGNQLYIYGLNSEDGTIFGEMDPRPAIGDTVKVLSVIGNYNGAQLKGACLLDWTPAESNDPVDADIQTIIDAKVGLYSTSGIVLGTNAKSFIIWDTETDAKMLVYLDRTPEVTVGDIVEIMGTTTTYGGCKQFGTDTAIIVTGFEEIEFGEAYRPDAAELDSFMSSDRVLVNYVTVEGLLDITNGYYNLYFDGAAIVGSLTYPDQVLASELEALNGQTVTLTGFITNTASNGKFLSIMVHEVAQKEPEQPAPIETDIDTVLTSPDGLYTASGIVIAVNAQSFLMDDGSGSILVYLQAQPNVKVGDVVTVTGTTKMYANAKQFAQDTVITVTGSMEIELPDPYAPTAEEIDSLLYEEQIFVNYVQLTGTLVISEDGKYYNFYFDGATLIGSLTYPDAALKEILDPLNGETFTVIGFITGISGGGQYLNIMVDKIVSNQPEIPDDPEPEPDPEEPIETDITTVLTGADGIYTTSGVVLAVNAQSFVLADDTGSLLVYLGTAPNVKVGDLVTITGTTKMYANAKQFAQDTVITVTGSMEIELPDPYVPTAEEIDFLLYEKQIFVNYVQLTGTLVISDDGKYYNFYFDGTTLIGSLTYPDAALKEILDPLNGETFTVIGFITGISGGGQYLNIMVDTVVSNQPEIPDDLTAQQILDLAYGLADGETTEQTFTLTGVISQINTPWKEMYQNITVTIIVDGNADQPIMCYRLQGNGAQYLQVGDMITVTGSFKNYRGTIEFDQGCNLDKVHVEQDGSGYDLLPISEALEIANNIAHNQSTIDRYYVRGTVTEIVNTTYGNMYLSDGAGNVIYLYGLYSEDGSLRFDALETQPAVGDTILIYTTLSNYNGPQLKNAHLIEIQ